MCKIMSGEVLGWTLRVLMNPDVLLTINGWLGREGQFSLLLSSVGLESACFD